jgi:nitrogen fixation-related uncharacterized protein
VIVLAGLVAFLLPVVALAAFALAALRWGVDSRDGSSDPRRPDHPVGIG